MNITGQISEYSEGVAAWADHLQIESHQQGHDATTILAVSGELDLGSVPVMQSALSRAADAGAELIVLDLANLRFIDSSGISVLVGAQLRANREERRLVLRNVAAQTARVLAVSGLEATFTLDAPA